MNSAQIMAANRTAILASSLLAGGVLAADTARADTVISGGNIINQTWNTAGSPYIVQGDITVPVGAFLNIEAGVIVRAATSDAQASGLDVTRVEITIAGELEVNGTAAAPVLFESSGAVAASWYGLVITTMAAAANIDYATITEAQTGIRNSSQGAVLQVSRLTISTYTTALNMLAGNVTFDGMMLTGGVTGITASGTASVTISNSVIASHAGVGFDSTASDAGVFNIISGCTIHGNSAGVRINAALGTTMIRNCNITSNATYGVQRVSTSSVNVTYCNTWNNATANYFNVSAGVGSISANPNYAAPPGNLSLMAGSASIDAGGPGCTGLDILGISRPQDGDGIGGEQCDMGAYEFAFNCSPTITSQPPASIVAGANEPVVISVTVTGEALAYRWRRDGVELADGGQFWGTGTATLLIYPAADAHEGNYDVYITSPCGLATSTSCALAVHGACPADIVADDAVDVLDLLAVINGWGACPP